MQHFIISGDVYEKQMRKNVINTPKKHRFSTLSSEPVFGEQKSMQCQFKNDSVHSLEPIGPRPEFGVNTISQGRLIESSINQIVSEYKVKLNSKKNRIPKPLPGDLVLQKNVFGGTFGKKKREVSQEKAIEP